MLKEAKMEEKYKLHIGCHRHTLTSRDSEVREFKTRNEAYENYLLSKRFWESIGYVVWFANIVHSDEAIEQLVANPYF